MEFTRLLPVDRHFLCAAGERQDEQEVETHDRENLLHRAKLRREFSAASL
jgi:hypothetical protein